MKRRVQKRDIGAGLVEVEIQETPPISNDYKPHSGLIKAAEEPCWPENEPIITEL